MLKLLSSSVGSALARERRRSRAQRDARDREHESKYEFAHTTVRGVGDHAPSLPVEERVVLLNIQVRSQQRALEQLGHVQHIGLLIQRYRRRPIQRAVADWSARTLWRFEEPDRGAGGRE